MPHPSQHCGKYMIILQELCVDILAEMKYNKDYFCSLGTDVSVDCNRPPRCLWPKPAAAFRTKVI